MEKDPAVAVPLDPLASYVYIQQQTSRICLQPRPSFAWINNPDPQMFFFMKKDFMAFSMDGSRIRTPLRRKFTFYH